MGAALAEIIPEGEKNASFFSFLPRSSNGTSHNAPLIDHCREQEMSSSQSFTKELSCLPPGGECCPKLSSVYCKYDADFVWASELSIALLIWSCYHFPRNSRELKIFIVSDDLLCRKDGVGGPNSECLRKPTGNQIDHLIVKGSDGHLYVRWRGASSADAWYTTCQW